MSQLKQKIIRQHGKPDTKLLVDVCNFLQRNYGILAKREWYLGFERDHADYSLYNLAFVKPAVSELEVRNYKLLNLDILINEQTMSMPLVIEVDGIIHHYKTKNTERRNEILDNADIDKIIVDTEELKLIKKSWKEFLNKELPKYGLFPRNH